MGEQSDHDILIEVKTIVEGLKEQFDNHLTHHFRYNLMAWGVALGAIVTLAIALVKLL